MFSRSTRVWAIDAKRTGWFTWYAAAAKIAKLSVSASTHQYFAIRQR